MTLQSFVAYNCCTLLFLAQLMLQKVQLLIDFAAFLLFHPKKDAPWQPVSGRQGASFFHYSIPVSCALFASSMAFSARSFKAFPVVAGEKIHSTRKSSSPVLMI